jgi:hypothetical protein
MATNKIKLLKKNTWHLVHGVREDNPAGALKNLAVVRMPVIVQLLLYLENEIAGHPIAVDFGFGTWPSLIATICSKGWVGCLFLTRVELFLYSFFF